MVSTPVTGFGAARRLVTTLGLSTALIAGGLHASAQAAPMAPSRLLPAAACTPDATQIDVFSFNDFHGRINAAPALFTPVEQARAAGRNVLLLSNGDNIGGSTFESASQEDKPTLDILNAAGVEASATGNHEYDRGLSDLTGRVSDIAKFDYLVSNVTVNGQVPAPLQPYVIKEVNGVKVAIIGAVTHDLPSLVSPAGLNGAVVGDPVQAVNKYAAQLSDGNPDNGEAQVIIAEIHEGAADGSRTAAENAATSAAFSSIYTNVSPKVDVVFNGHTHQTYSWTTSNNGVPLMQAASYGTKLAKVTLSVDATGACGTPATELITPPSAADTSLSVIANIKSIADAATKQADVVGAKVIAQATAPISLPGGLMKPDQRDKESPMTNLVAQSFLESVKGDRNTVIGIQNPGGTRAGFDAGDITLKEAALALPFANTIKSTELTGAQFKKVLEQQWQTDAQGNVPSRAFLRLGLSDNVTYTYDETRPAGDRITSITVNGQPVSMTGTYTFVSGNFLIDGGDNFREFANGSNMRDTGLVDLTTFVDWVQGKKTLSPDFSQRGVSVRGVPATVVEGGRYTISEIGVPAGVAVDTLDSTGQGAVKNTSATAYLRQGDKVVKVGTAPVVNGTVTDMVVRLPLGSGLVSGKANLIVKADRSGTYFEREVSIVAAGTTYGPGDQSGDKFTDILGVDSNGWLRVYFGKRAGLTGVSSPVGSGWDSFLWMSKVPDVTGDKIDEVLGLRKDGTMYLYVSRGMGQFGSARLVGRNWLGLRNYTVVGDVNGDRQPELVAIAKDGSLLRYTIQPGRITGQKKIGQNWQGITFTAGAGDWNKDGIPDLYAVTTKGDLYVYLFGRDGRIVKTQKVGRGWGNFTAMFTPGDMTGDGVPDIVGRRADGNLYLYENRQGSFRPAVLIGTGWQKFTLFA